MLPAYIPNAAKTTTKTITAAAEQEADAQATAYAKQATETFMTENAEAIQKDPVGFVNSVELFQTAVPVTDAEGNYVLDA